MLCEFTRLNTANRQGGWCTGLVTDVALFPLDTIKTRLQSAQGFRAAGGLSRLYAGLGPAALGSAPGGQWSAGVFI